MSDDLGRYFAGMREDVTHQGLAASADLRALGARRRRSQYAAIAGAGLVAAVLAGGAVALSGGRSGPPAPALPPPVAPAAALSASQSALPGSSATGSPAVRGAGAPCRAGDLDPRPYYEAQGAAGSQIQRVEVQNTSPTPCTLSGYPQLRYAAAGSPSPTPIPELTPVGTAGQVLLGPGDFASFGLAEALAPDLGAGVACHDRSYQNISVDLDGTRFPLTGFTLSWRCGPGRLDPWLTAAPPVPSVALTRAPAPTPS